MGTRYHAKAIMGVAVARSALWETIGQRPMCPWHKSVENSGPGPHCKSCGRRMPLSPVEVAGPLLSALAAYRSHTGRSTGQTELWDHWRCGTLADGEVAIHEAASGYSEQEPWPRSPVLGVELASVGSDDSEATEMPPLLLQEAMRRVRSVMEAIGLKGDVGFYLRLEASP